MIPQPLRNAYVSDEKIKSQDLKSSGGKLGRMPDRTKRTALNRRRANQLHREGQGMGNDGQGDRAALPPPTPEAIGTQLYCILASPEFQLPERGRAFLRYVVEESLSGRAKRIKAYSIAVEVFGRDEG
jgi:hypothetical protein